MWRPPNALPDNRKVMEPASVARRSQRLAAKLAKTHDLAAEVVRDAESAAYNAAAERGERARVGDG